VTLLQIRKILENLGKTRQTRSQSTSQAIVRISKIWLKMAEEVGFEPTFLSNESVNGFRFIGKLTILRAVRQAEAEKFWGL
jgi:hypothetical protein